jgi:hypothetical protein
MTLLRLPAAAHAWTPVKIAILSGLSDPSTCALSELQTKFLAAIDAPEEWKIYANFPYVDCSGPRRNPPLWLASWRNFRQFSGASGTAYGRDARRHWRALRESAAALVIITLSCGLEILRHCVDGDDAGRTHVLALGPVARGLPAIACTLVQGSADPISRIFFKHAHVSLSAGHMSYLDDPAVLRLANELVCGSTSTSSEPASISRSTG